MAELEQNCQSLKEKLSSVESVHDKCQVINKKLLLEKVRCKVGVVPMGVALHVWVCFQAVAQDKQSRRESLENQVRLGRFTTSR